MACSSLDAINLHASHANKQEMLCQMRSKPGKTLSV